MTADPIRIDIPAGWLLSADPVEPDLAGTVTPDPQHPRLLFDATVTGSALAAALRELPPAARATVQVAAFAAGRGAGRIVAAQAAADLGEPVTLVNGLPFDTGVYALDAELRPVWAEPARLLRCRPDGREEVVASDPPRAGLPAVDPVTYAIEGGWLIRVSGNGLHAMPAEARTEPAAYEPGPDGRYRVVVGTPGRPIDDAVWPALSGIFIAALTGLPGEVALEVAGEPTKWGRSAAAKLAERHPGAGLGPAGEEPDPPLSEPSRRRPGRLLIGAAAVVVALGAGAVAAAWPHDSGGNGPAGAPANGYTGPGLAPEASGSAAGARNQASARASRSSVRPSGSASGPPAPPPTSDGGTSPSPQALNLNVFNLAAGRVTRDSGHADPYGSGNIADADPGTYWEGRGNAFPAWVQVDLGAAAAPRRAVLRLPPSDAWPARTQRVEVQASNDDKTFTTVAGAATYTFDPASGQRVTVALPGTSWRYIRVVFTANSVQAAGQLSGLELYLA
ncbi:discoidin domain-containing protein [Dactylosporangium sp. CS-047395]|uniref:discoidin domain-containing protein n=1 Tax=Dactylosporangium sp. CS-047395 TaxID=3239936 RepID=UPI003D90113C